MKRKKLVIVGFGTMGQAIGKVAARTTWIDLVGVVDPAKHALESAQSIFNLSKSSLRHKMAHVFDSTNPDIIFINSPAEFHYRQVISSIKHGCDVLVAKPLATKLTQAQKIVQVANRFNRKVAVGHQIRFNRHYRALKEFIDQGIIGNIESVVYLNSKQRPQPCNLQSMKYPALIEMTCHHFDNLLSLLTDGYPQSIVATGFSPSWSSYDGVCMVNAMITFSNHTNVLYHGGFSARAPFYELRLEGSKGVLKCRGEHMSAGKFLYELSRNGSSFEAIDIEEKISHETPWEIYMTHLFKYLYFDIEPPFSAARNVSVLALISAAIKSIESGRKIVLDNSRNCTFNRQDLNASKMG